MQSTISAALQCPVCFEQYNQQKCLPRILHAGHTCCDSCIHQLPRHDGAVLRCPLCNLDVFAPTGLSISPFPTNHAVLDIVLALEEERSRQEKQYQQGDEAKEQQCYECDTDAGSDCLAVVRCTACRSLLCHTHAQSHGKSKRTKGHPLETLEAVKWKICRAHPGQLLTYYCVPCDQLICLHCSLSAAHAEHARQETAEAWTHLSPSLQQLLAAAGETKEKIRLTSQQQQAASNELRLFSNKAISDLQTQMVAVHEALHEREDKMGESILKYADSKLEHLHSQQADLDSVGDTLCQLLQQLQTAVDEKALADAIQYRNLLQPQLAAAEGRQDIQAPASSVKHQFTIDCTNLLAYIPSCGQLGEPPQATLMAPPSIALATWNWPANLLSECHKDEVGLTSFVLEESSHNFYQKHTVYVTNYGALWLHVEERTLGWAGPQQPRFQYRAPLRGPLPSSFQHILLAVCAADLRMCQGRQSNGTFHSYQILESLQAVLEMMVKCM